MASGDEKFPVLEPELQIAFYYILQDIKEQYLLNALRAAVKQLDIARLDDELSGFVAQDPLQLVASYGIRGEVFFPVPLVLQADPHLLGYYRLLYGLSQKEAYNRGPFGRFSILEHEGEIPERLRMHIPALCRSWAKTGELLVDGLDSLSLETVHDLQMLTVGPQLRGSQNTKIGQRATAEVFELIGRIVQPYVKESTKRSILLENDSGRPVLIVFSAGPDIRITEKLASGTRPLVSVEIKGGRDESNIHNRLGEAEKSHQKAKNRGFFEFWTILKVGVDEAAAKRESPTTSHFFQLDEIAEAGSDDHNRFRSLLGSVIGIKA